MEISSGGAFTDHLGIELTEVTEDRVVATWTAGERHHQPYGIVHGGVHASVVETLGSVGSAVWAEAHLSPGTKVVGVNNNTDFFRAVSQGALTSTATPVHQGRSQQIWVVETRDADGRLVSRGQLRVQNLSA